MRDALDRKSLMPFAIALLAICLVAFFDVQNSIPFLDEYARRWTIGRIADGHGLVFWGTSPNLAEIVAALPLALLRLPPEYWRWAGLPFLAMGGVFSWLLARRAGADRFWSSVAASVSVVTPIGLSLATGIMTETAFVPLLLGAAWFGLRWVFDGKGMACTVAFALACTLQRQQGATIAVFVSAGLLLASRRRGVARRDLVWLAVLWFTLLVAIGGVELYHLKAGSLSTDLAPQRGFQPSPVYGPVVLVVEALASLSVVGGLVLTPFLLGVLGRTDAERQARGRAEMVPVILAMISAVFIAGTVILLAEPMYLGYVWGAKGLGLARESSKPDLLPLPLFVAIEVATMATAAFLLVWRRRVWRWSILGSDAGLLVVLAALQLGAYLVYGQIFDRYYLPVLAPLVPVVAAIASRSAPTRWAAGWAVAALVGNVGLYAVAEQDFQAAMAARDRAAQVAYSEAAPDQVAAGFEEVAVHVWIPAADHPNSGLPQFLSDHPKLVITFTGPNDPRPGFSYSSIAPGKVVIVPCNC